MTTAVFLAPLSVAGGPFFIPGGNQPAAGGQLFSYITGSSTKLATYTTSSGAVANSNPIVLDSGGFVTGSGEVWLIQSSTYRFILAPSTDTDPPASPYWTRDSISGINDVQTQINVAGQEFIAFSTTPVFSNASSFVLSGDQRTTFSLGRRVKTTNSGGTIYGTITSTVFTTSTAVGIATDSGGLDAGLSAVSYGLLSTPDGSMPWTNVTATGNTVTSNSLTVVNMTTGSLQIGSVGKVSSVSTAGRFGVPIVVGTGKVTNQTTSSSILVFTVGSSSGSFYVTANLRVNNVPACSFNVLLLFTDPEGQSSAIPLQMYTDSTQQITSTVTSGSNRQYMGVPIHIHASSLTTITVSTGGASFSSVNYNAEALISQYN